LLLFLQVLFRSGVLNQLEAKRDELLSDRIIQLQAFCRGYLARRRVGQRRVQVRNLLIKCLVKFCECWKTLQFMMVASSKLR
jgi:myosin-18